MGRGSTSVEEYVSEMATEVDAHAVSHGRVVAQPPGLAFSTIMDHKPENLLLLWVSLGHAILSQQQKVSSAMMFKQLIILEEKKVSLFLIIHKINSM